MHFSFSGDHVNTVAQMALHEVEGVHDVPPTKPEPETKPVIPDAEPAIWRATTAPKPPRKFKLPQISIDFAPLKKRFSGLRIVSYKPIFYKLFIAFVISFVFLTVYLSGSKLCKPGQSRRTSCLALGLCSNRNDQQNSIANKIRTNVICPFHNVVDQVVSKTSAVITGSEDPFGAESMVPGIDLSVLIF